MSEGGLVKLSTIFDVRSGSKLDFGKMQVTSHRDPDGVNFVSRSSNNLGVVGRVKKIAAVEPFCAGEISIALGGSLLSSFVQSTPFYTAEHMVVLVPKEEMSFKNKLFYCLCLGRNRFKYSTFGREADRTIRSLLVPSIHNIPRWIAETKGDGSGSSAKPAIVTATSHLDITKWFPFRIDKLFELKRGKRVNKLDSVPGKTPFVSATMRMNGIIRYTNAVPNHSGNTLSVAYDGSVGEVFYQPVPFWASDHIYVLYPKFDLTPATGLFLSTVLRLEGFRYNFGRAWTLDRMRVTEVRLPTTHSLEPDWDFMEKFVKSLPYSSGI